MVYCDHPVSLIFKRKKNEALNFISRKHFVCLAYLNCCAELQQCSSDFIRRYFAGNLWKHLILCQKISQFW